MQADQPFIPGHPDGCLVLSQDRQCLANQLASHGSKRLSRLISFLKSPSKSSDLHISHAIYNCNSDCKVPSSVLTVSMNTFYVATMGNDVAKMMMFSTLEGAGKRGRPKSWHDYGKTRIVLGWP